MTATKTQSGGQKGSAGLLFTGLYLAAMVLLYVGERLVLESTAIRAVLGGLAVAGIAVAIAGRISRRRKVPAEARTVEVKPEVPPTPSNENPPAS